jgi:hypothetical protein
MAIAAILSLIVCYQFSISKTISERQRYIQQKNIAGSKNNNRISLQMAESKSRMLDNVLNEFVLDTLNESKNLLSIIGDYCGQHDLELKEYRPKPISQNDSIKIWTRVVTVEGNFDSCLQFIYSLETKYKAGRVSSVLYKSYQDLATSRPYLICTIYIQNIIPSQYEKS